MSKTVKHKMNINISATRVTSIQKVSFNEMK